MNLKKSLTSVVASAVVMMMALAGCQSGSYTGGHVNLNSKMDSVSYAFGYMVGSNLKSAGMDDINPQKFAQGMAVAVSGDSSQISTLKGQAMVRRYQMKARQEKMKQRQKLAKKNKKKGQAFLKKNKSKSGVKTTESGLEYKVLKEGSGATPTKKDTVVFSYTGRHLNGKIFDQGDSVTIAVKNVIPGWQEGLQLMKEGATYKLWIPGQLAYGLRVKPGGPLEPNETLQFKVHLIKVK